MANSLSPPRLPRQVLPFVLTLPLWFRNLQILSVFLRTTLTTVLILHLNSKSVSLVVTLIVNKLIISFSSANMYEGHLSPMFDLNYQTRSIELLDLTIFLNEISHYPMARFHEPARDACGS